VPCTYSTPGYSGLAWLRQSNIEMHREGRTQVGLEPSPGRMCGSKRFCFMHLAAAAGFLSIPSLVAFMLSPTGRSMAATAWAWLKGVFHKMTASSPRGILFVVHKRSRSGDEFDLVFSTHDAKKVARLLQSSPASLLKQLPAALGGDCPTAHHVPANPEPLPPLVPPQLSAPQLLDSNESRSRSTKSAMPAKKRRPRGPRAGCGLTSSRRIGGGSRGYRSGSRRKRG